MNICFLEKTNFKYNSKDIYSNDLRGAETVLINLSKALSNQGHNITIFNNLNLKIKIFLALWY